MSRVARHILSGLTLLSLLLCGASGVFWMRSHTRSGWEVALGHATHPLHVGGMNGSLFVGRWHGTSFDLPLQPYVDDSIIAHLRRAHFDIVTITFAAPFVASLLLALLRGVSWLRGIIRKRAPMASTREARAAEGEMRLWL